MEGLAGRFSKFRNSSGETWRAEGFFRLRYLGREARPGSYITIAWRWNTVGSPDGVSWRHFSVGRYEERVAAGGGGCEGVSGSSPPSTVRAPACPTGCEI